MEQDANEETDNTIEDIESFPNDPMSEQEPEKGGRGRPKKTETKGKKVATSKPTPYNTRNRPASNTSKPEAAHSAKFVLDDQRLINSGMNAVTSWAQECENLPPKHGPSAVDQ